MGPPVLRRRELLTGLLGGRELAVAGTAGTLWAWLVGRAAAGPAPRRPPGALGESDFLATCIKCGQCSGACPYGTLQVATAAGPTLPGTPFFEPRRIPCYMCPDAPCIAACPSGALRPGTAIEDARMGLAVLLDQQHCIAFQGLRCEICYRACPLLGRAIRLEYEPQERTGKHAYFIPVVDADACTGCGMCEHACILPEPAIRVLPPELARGAPGEHYRLGWLEDATISRDFGPADAEAPAPWQDNTGRVLEGLEDLQGIEEP